MNKKILVIVATLLTVAMLATPVFGDSPKKIPVTVETSGGYFTPPPPEAVWTSGNVQHGRGFTGGHAHYNITGIGMDDLNGSMETYYGDYNINLKNGHGIIRRKMVITLAGGTFEGLNIQHGICVVMGGVFPNLMDGNIRAVFHGTGDYLGWTLVRTIERPSGITETFLLIP